MINFDDAELVLKKLHFLFHAKKGFNISSDSLIQYEGEIVYNYFHRKAWYNLAVNLDFTLDGEALEKGCAYLNPDEFKNYFPLYIYASLINNEGWAFEFSFFHHYLIPGVMEERVFFDFVDGFTEKQKEIIYNFIRYKAEIKKDLMAMDALYYFWDLYA